MYNKTQPYQKRSGRKVFSYTTLLSRVPTKNRDSRPRPKVEGRKVQVFDTRGYRARTPTYQQRGRVFCIKRFTGRVFVASGSLDYNSFNRFVHQKKFALLAQRQSNCFVNSRSESDSPGGLNKYRYFKISTPRQLKDQEMSILLSDSIEVLMFEFLS